MLSRWFVTSLPKDSALLKTDDGKLEAISDLQTYGMIENIAKRVIVPSRTNVSQARRMP